MGLKVGLGPLFCDLVQNLVFIRLFRKQSVNDWLYWFDLHQVLCDAKQATFEASRFRLNYKSKDFVAISQQ
jgi:hypothetical protein